MSRGTSQALASLRAAALGRPHLPHRRERRLRREDGRFTGSA